MSEGMNHTEGSESEQLPPKQLNRRQFLTGLGAVAAVSVIGTGEVQANVPQELINAMEDEKTLRNLLTGLTDEDLLAINNGTFTRDSQLYLEVAVEGKEGDDISHRGNIALGATAGAVVGAGVLRALPPLAMDAEVDSKALATHGAVLGAVAGGVLAGHESVTDPKGKYKHSGYLGGILGRYRDEGRSITREVIDHEVKILEQSISSLKERRKPFLEKK